MPADPSRLWRTFFLLVAVFLSVFTKTASAESSADFRLVRWGMNRFQVMAAERFSPIKFEARELLFRVLLFDRPAYLIYRFLDGRVVGARYVFPTKSTDSMEGLEGLISLGHGPFLKTFESESVRLWKGKRKVVRLYLRPEGEAIVDIVSPDYGRGVQEETSRAEKLLKQEASRIF